MRRVGKVSKVKTALLAAIMAPAIVALSSAAWADSIFDAMAKAYENNPDLNAARAGLRATDEGVTIAKAGWRPQVSGFGQMTKTRYSGADLKESTNSPDVLSKSVGLTITQQVFDGFQTLNRVRAAESNVYSERANLKATEIQTLLSAAQSYANIARDQEIVSIRKQNLAFLREQVNAAKSRLEVGEGTKTDVSLAEAELAQAEGSLANADFQLKQSRAVYVQIVGDAPKSVRQAKPLSKTLPESIDDAVATGWREHPAVVAAMYAIDSAGFQVKTAEGALLPGVVVQGQVSANDGHTDWSSLNNYNSSSVTARINVPIYQGGAEYGEIRQAKERLGQQQIQLDSVRLEVQRTIVASIAQFDAAKAMIEAGNVQLQAAQQALDGVLEERKVGQATTLDVLDYQARVLNAKESLASANRDAVVASFGAVAAMGHLTIETVGLKVARYEPEEHYNKVKDKWFGLRTVDGR
ncbi:TolC family outer membrane protein [Rhizobium sp. FKL33]|uniref:TolC family outer membrane protein n=1 Tax=Rhizobium sp. FKL33 TaxID=2562307 RepID=UPI0010BF72D4|nr:TolC family outer membrane protein [Rhizobium sp. FKL33]